MDRGLVREHHVALRQPGRTAILVELTEAGRVALAAAGQESSA